MTLIPVFGPVAHPHAPSPFPPFPPPGHTAFVCALAVASDGRLLASCQEGKEAIVRLWDTANCACLAILNGEGTGQQEPGA